MSTRLRVLGSEGHERHEPSPERTESSPLRARFEPRVVTVSAVDARSDAFARALVDALLALGRRALHVGARATTAAAADGSSALDAALGDPDALVVVSQSALAASLSGRLDVWIGPRPTGDAQKLAVHTSCQLQVRTSPGEPLVSLLAAELLRSV